MPAQPAVPAVTLKTGDGVIVSAEKRGEIDSEGRNGGDVNFGKIDAIGAGIGEATGDGIGEATGGGIGEVTGGGIG